MHQRLTPLPAPVGGDRYRFLSYGGGTQSAMLALASAAGDLPTVDAVIFADTGGELPETYLYAEYVRRALDRAGIPFVTVSAGNLEEALLSPVPLSKNPTPPAHTIQEDGRRGRINNYRCSWDYKRRVITRATKELVGGRGAWKRQTIEQWVGMSVDELSRCKPDPECRCGHNRTRPPYRDTGEPRGHTPACTDCSCPGFDPWRVNVWPLVDLRYRRGDTIAWFTRNGHPTPPRSACWFCPNQGNARWRELRDSHPDLWERAVKLDEHIRHGGSFNQRGDGTNPLRARALFLHGSAIPLRDADLRSSLERTVDAGQGDLFDGAELGNACEAGVCFT